MRKANLRQFDPVKVGTVDAAMWRAYYNHKFFKLFWLLIKLLKNQLGLSLILTLRLSYYAALAAADYRINRGNLNSQRVLKNITCFYGIISQHATEPFDFDQAAKLELAWWEVHRASNQNNPELERALAASQAAIYKIPVDKFKNYARFRAEAMIIPRHQGDNVTNRPNWAKIESLTIKSWQALHLVINDR